MARVELSKAIIKQILLRLPVKSLLRFKSVSKEWKSSISSSEFINDHVKIASKNSGYIKLICGSKTTPCSLDTCSIQSLIHKPINEDIVFDSLGFRCPAAEPGSTFTFSGSCNGLVCLLVNPNIIVVWNPTTRESIYLQRPTNLLPRTKILSCGFGYDEMTDDYKVVHLYNDTHVQVYSLRNDSWKTLRYNTGNTITIREEYGKFVHGFIHWTGYSLLDNSWAVFSYQLADEFYMESDMPDIEKQIYYEMDVLGGCLAISSQYGEYMDVWLMREYGETESWTRVLRIPFSYASFINDRPHPLFLLGNNRILMKHQTSLKICYSGSPQTQRVGSASVFNAITYIESLVSPYKMLVTLLKHSSYH